MDANTEKVLTEPLCQTRKCVTK